MKAILLGAVLSLACLGAYAQGTVNMNTFGSGVNARATNSVTGAAAGLNAPASISVGLYLGTSADDLQLVGALATFGSSAGQSGYVLSSTGGGTRIAGQPGGANVFAQIKAWSTGFATYEAAIASGDVSKVAGRSNIVPVTLATPPLGTPTALLGLQPFLLVPVPEPSVIALGILGVVGALFLRRRK